MKPANQCTSGLNQMSGVIFIIFRSYEVSACKHFKDGKVVLKLFKFV